MSPGDDLGDPRQRVLAVAGIDAFRRVADEEVLLPLHARMLLDHGHADFLGRPRIDGGFEHDRRAALQVPADRFARAQQRPEVRLMGVVDRCRHRDHDEVGLRKRRGVRRGHQQRRLPQVLGRDFAGRIDEAPIGVDLGLREVEADRADTSCRIRRRAEARRSPDRLLQLLLCCSS